jgi:hypothetical protein
MNAQEDGNVDTGYSVSINYRRTGTNLLDVARNFMRGAVRAWPIGYLVRQVLSSTPDFSTAMAQLASSDLMAPVYITMAGSRPSQGVILTRDRTGDVHRKYLTPTEAVIQTNMDHFRPDDADDEQNICNSVARRKMVRRYLSNLNPTRTFDDLWHLCTIRPVLAEDHIYTVSMSAGLGEYTTRIYPPSAD